MEEVRTSATCMNTRLPSSLLLASLLTVPTAFGATTIEVSSTPVLTNVKRLGMNISFHTYYDSRLMMKELCFRNPGFEGLLFQSILPVATATATTMTDTNAYTQWRDGYWDGATCEFITGTARGRTTRISRYVSAPDGQATVGSSYTFEDSGAIPAAGDLFILRRAANENPQAGWWDTSTGVTITGETADLAPDTPGRQALRAVSTTAGGALRLASNIDTWPNISFIQLNGNYRVSFKAKSRSGTNTVAVRVQRGNTVLLSQNVTLATSWTTQTLTFGASETGNALGAISLSLSTSGQFELLLDDVSFTQTDSSPSNPTPFRDPVVDALRQFRPAIVRGLQTTLGDTLDNALAPLLARRRSGYTTYGMDEPNMGYNFHEFLELCAHVGAEPWMTFPVVFTEAEMRNFIEYLAGPATSPYGARRAARGQARPWTEVFSKIHLEFGNESWNATNYLGGAITNPARYGARGGELFAQARSSPWFSTEKFNLILGAHGSETVPALSIHNASAQHDALAVDGYFFTEVNNFASDEEIFGSLFAAPEAYNTTLYLGEMGRRMRSSSRPVPLAVYEGNINTTRGAIFGSQSALTAATASLGAGLAVAHDYLMRMKLLQMRDQCVFNLGGYVVRSPDAAHPNNVSYIWGTVLDMGVTNRKRPTYLATQLANEAIAGDLVQTTHRGDDPTWNQPDINRIPGGFANAHHLHSYAFVSADGARSLVLFNLHRTSALAVNFSGPHAPAGTVTLRRLTSAAITDHNEERVMVAAPTTQTLANFSAAQDMSLPPFSMSVLQWNTSSGGAPNPPPTTPPPTTPDPTPPPTTPPPTTPPPTTPPTTPPPTTPTPSPATTPSGRGGGGGSPSALASLALTLALLCRRRLPAPLRNAPR